MRSAGSVRSILLVLAAAAGISGCDRSTGPRTGSLTITINGLPSEIPGAVTVTSPDQTTLPVTSTRTIPDLDPGKYQITAANASNDKSTFAPDRTTGVVEVLAGNTPAQATVTYSVITAVLSVSITGAPAGTVPSVTITGTAMGRTIYASGDVGNLIPGSYSVTAADVESGELYHGVAMPDSLNLTPSATPVPVTVSYTVITGTLMLTASGLPAGATATWDIVGQGGFKRTVSGSPPLVVPQLAAGQYAVSARNVIYGPDTYGTTANPALVTIVAGQSASLATTYVISPPTFNLVVAGAYLVQSTQNLSGTVPLVAGRDAYLRVFVRANETNNVAPQVRVRFYRAGQIVATQTLSAPASAVPTSTSEANATDAWNATISGSLLQPGTSFLVDVDPANAIHEAIESDNQYPANGVPASLDIRNVAPLNIRFVPIATGDGLVGNVTEARFPELLDLTLRMHPMSAIFPDLRNTYTTSNVFVDGDTNGAWQAILSEIEVIRVAEGSGRYYVGIVKNNGHSAWGGYGYIGGKSSVSLDVTAAGEVISHELGHNWARRHAPCGGADAVDPFYPYPGGVIGRYGYDQATGRILPASMPDVMGYCWLPFPFNLAMPRQWVSDYTYTGVFNYRSTHAASVQRDERPQECLIVWGRVTEKGLVLEPALTIVTKPVLPETTGAFRLSMKDAAGATIKSLSFDVQKVADGRESDGHFVFAIPVSEVSASLSSLELSRAGVKTAVMTAHTLVGATPPVTITTGSGFVRLTWDPALAPLLIVRDPNTREIISLARTGQARVETAGRSVIVSASNGVRSIDMQLKQ